MKLTIKTSKGSVDIEAHPSKVRGLVIHYSVGHEGWSVTHAGSGRAVLSRLTSKRVALDAAQRLGKLADWTLHKDELFGMKAVGKKVAAMRERIALYR